MICMTCSLQVMIVLRCSFMHISSSDLCKHLRRTFWLLSDCFYSANRNVHSNRTPAWNLSPPVLKMFYVKRKWVSENELLMIIMCSAEELFIAGKSKTIIFRTNLPHLESVNQSNTDQWVRIGHTALTSISTIVILKQSIEPINCTQSEIDRKINNLCTFLKACI